MNTINITDTLKTTDDLRGDKLVEITSSYPLRSQTGADRSAWEERLVYIKAKKIISTFRRPHGEWKEIVDGGLFKFNSDGELLRHDFTDRETAAWTEDGLVMVSISVYGKEGWVEDLVNLDDLESEVAEALEKIGKDIK